MTKSPPLTREGVDALLDSARLLTPGLFGDQSGDADGVGRLPDAVGLRHDAGGVIRVGQSRISLDLVVDQFEDGATPEEMVRAYDTLRLADVYAAIAYYLRHRDKVASYLERRRAEAEALQQRIEAERPPISRDELVRRQREAEHAHAPTRK